MYVVKQYQDVPKQGMTIVKVANADSAADAVKACQDAEAAYSGRYGAAFFTKERSIVIAGDAYGLRNPEPPEYDRGGSVLTGRD